MKIQGSTALVTGANRGLGAAIVADLLARGAAKVYAGARDITAVRTDDPRVVAVRLDVTDDDDVSAAAALATDVDVVVNNAGIPGVAGSLLTGDPARAREEVETNFWGSVRVLRAFAPILAANGGGAVVNVLSILSFLAGPSTAAYSASKAAGWSFTVAARRELRAQGTQVVGVHVGYMDTDMTAGIDAPKTSPHAVAAQIGDALESGADEVLADEISQDAKRALSGAPAGLEV